MLQQSYLQACNDGQRNGPSGPAKWRLQLGTEFTGGIQNQPYRQLLTANDDARRNKVSFFQHRRGGELQADSRQAHR